MEVYEDLFETNLEESRIEQDDSNTEQKPSLRRRRLMLSDDSSDQQAQYLRGKEQGHRRLFAEHDDVLRMELMDSSDTAATMMEGNKNTNGNNHRLDMANWSVSLVVLVIVAFGAHKKRSNLRKRHRSDYQYEGIRMNKADLDHLSDDWGSN